MGNWYSFSGANNQGTSVTWTYSSDNSTAHTITPYVKFEPATYYDPDKDPNRPKAKKAAKAPELAWLDDRVSEITDLVPV